MRARVLITLRSDPALGAIDDFVLLGGDKAALRRLKAAIRELLAAELGLTLKERVTRVGRCQDGVPLLGFAVYPGVVKLQGERKRRTLRRIRERERQRWAGALPEELAARCVESALAHIAHAGTAGLRRRWFSE